MTEDIEYDSNDEERSTALIQFSSYAAERRRKRMRKNFLLASLLFGINHGSVISMCILSTSAYGSKLESLEVGTIILTYFLTASIGAATYVTKNYGPRDSMIIGMGLCCAYQTGILISYEVVKVKAVMIIIGGILGGIGCALMWTGQGVYFACTCEEYQEVLSYKEDAYLISEDSDEEEIRTPPPLEYVTSRFGALFAGIFISTEIILILLSRLLLYLKIQWTSIYAIYVGITIVSAGTMFFVEGISKPRYISEDEHQLSIFKEPLTFWGLLVKDPRLKYFIPFNISFSVTFKFMETFVVPEASQITIMKGEPAFYNTLLSCVSGVVTILACITFAYWNKGGKDIQLFLGSSSTFVTALLFIGIRSKAQWGWAFFTSIYIFFGLARASFLTSLRAIFVDYFCKEKHSAFGHVVLQMGVGHFVGFLIAEKALCQETSTYCIRYTNNAIHNVLVFEVMILILSVLSVIALLRVRRIN